MNKVKKYFLSIGLFLVLFLLTFYFIFQKYSFAEFLQTLATCNLYCIAVAFLCVFFYLFFGTLFLKKLFAVFQINISYFQSLCYNCIEIYFSAVTPSSTGGQPVEVYYMARDKIPYRKSTIVILFNTILYKTAIVLLGIIGIICFPKLIFSNGHLFTLLMILGLLINIIVIGFFGCLIYSKTIPERIVNLGLKVLSFLHLLKPENRQRKQESIKEAMKDYHECAVFTKKHPKVLIKSFLIILAQRICLFIISYLIYRSFGLSEHHILTIFFLQIAITQAIDCVPFPGGVMVGESLTYQINALIYGASYAFSSMLLLRGISFYFLVLVSSIFFLIYHFKGIRKEVKT